MGWVCCMEGMVPLRRRKSEGGHVESCIKSSVLRSNAILKYLSTFVQRDKEDKNPCI